MSINYFKSALLHHSKGNWNKAKEIYEHILKSNPNNYSVLQNYGPLLSQLKEYKLAKNIFEKSLKIKPKDPLLLYNYAKFYHDQRIFEKAIQLYKESYEIEPRNNFSMYNIGNIYLSNNKFNLAITAYKNSLKSNPKNFLAFNNLANSYKNIGNFNEALKYYKESIKINNKNPDIHVNYATQLLMLENFEEGFEEYEWRKESKLFLDFIEYKKLKVKTPVWNGESLDNKTILIFSEQGIGDLFQFSRYLYLLKKHFKCSVIIRLKHNLSHIFDKNEISIISDKDNIPKHDYHNHLLSLPGIFYKKNKSFPENKNFFQYDVEKLNKWKNYFSSFKGLRVGINADSTQRAGATGLLQRKIPIEEFSILTELKGINFFIIQRDFEKEKLNIISNNSNVHFFDTLDKAGKPFEDTINIIKNLDLIITSDTSIAHLSATLEKKTWIALPFICDWRWFLKDEKSIWYKNVSLYRQKKDRNWKEIFKIIKENLKKELKSN